MSLFRHPMFRHPWVRRPLLLGLVAGLVVGGWMAVIMVEQVFFYYRAERNPYSSLAQIAAKRIVTRVVEPFYDHHLLATTDLPIYDLQLTPRRLGEWHEMLDRVFARGRSTEADRTYFPAVFYFGDESWQVDVRGRGTLSGHYHREKPSLRVKFPKDRFFEGRRVVNFIVPYEQTRIVVDTTLNAIAQQYGLVTYPRKFAVLRMNGKVLGVYQEMDHFRKELAVLQGRSEGFIVSGLGEGKGGASPSSHPGFNRAVEAMLQCHRSCPPAIAGPLLDQYFDAEKLAVYSALTTWFASGHAWGPDNLILFFDPAFGRFEPIPWDIGIHPLGYHPRTDKQAETEFESTTNLGDQFLRLPHFRALRNEILWDMLQRKQQFGIDEANRQWAAIQPELDVDTEYSRRRTRRFISGFRKIFNSNSAQLEKLLASKNLEIKASSSRLHFVNRAVAETEIEAVTLVYTDGSRQELVLGKTVPGKFREQPGRLTIDISEALANFGSSTFESSTIALSTVALSTDVTTHHGPRPALFDLQVTARNHLTQETLTPHEITWEWTDLATGPPHLDPQKTVQQPTIQPTLQPTIPAIDAMSAVPPGVTVIDDEWHFGGEIRLTESLVIPDHVRVVFEPGLRLFLDADVLLVIRGDLLSRGTAEQPIEVKASDPGHPFASLAVIGRPADPVVVEVEYTTIDGGREGDFLGIHLSGSFSIYSGALDMRHSRLLNAAGEDGLNVKYGSALIENTLFENTASDAVDLDFCSATLRHNTVRHTLGDGFDFSGSIIEASDNLFVDCADKGISIGEGTILLARRNTVRKGITGMAIKDSSLVQIEDFELQELEVGVAIYQKKQVFGSAMAKVHEMKPEEVASSFLTDPQATLICTDQREAVKGSKR